MDGTRQAVRWSIPGFIFVLEVCILQGFWLVIVGHDPYSVVHSVSTSLTLAVVFAGVPLGSLLYQLYYRNYKPSGRSMLLVLRYIHVLLLGRNAINGKWFFVRRDRGAEILHQYHQQEETRNLPTVPGRAQTVFMRVTLPS